MPEDKSCRIVLQFVEGNKYLDEWEDFDDFNFDSKFNKENIEHWKKHSGQSKRPWRIIKRTEETIASSTD